MKSRIILHAAAGCFLAAIGLLSGCKKDEAKPVVNNNLFGTVTVAATGGSFFYPSSAVPDAAGQFLYFTATDTAGAGVFRVPAAGGTATPVFVGAPFSRPLDLVLSTDNQTLYVADSGAGTIFSLPVSGGPPVAVPGTGGTRPMALDVIRRAGSDVLYFTGFAAAVAGKPAVLEAPADGSAPAQIRYEGAPFTTPAGIVSAKDGTLYIADRGGRVYQLSLSGGITPIAGGIIMGMPAGIALTPDDGTVAVSSKTASSGTAQVHLIDLRTGSTSIFNKEIGFHTDPGGLHGARDANGATGRYGWADVSRTGRVYFLGP